MITEELKILRFIVGEDFKSMKRRRWNKGILLFWNRLWIRKDEFHSSLEMDARAMLEMDKEERKKYINDLVKRRQIAHDRDMEASA